MQNEAISYRLARRTLSFLLRFIKNKRTPLWLSEDTWLLLRTLSLVKDATHAEKDAKVAEKDFARALAVSRALSATPTENDVITACHASSVREATLRLLPLALCADTLCEISRYIRKKRTPDKARKETWKKQMHAMLALDLEAVWEGASAVDAVLRAERSGVYARCDQRTRAEYRAAVYRLAKKEGLEETTAIKALIAEAKGKGKSMEEALFDEASAGHTGAYFATVALCTVLFSALAGACLYPFGMWRATVMSALLLLPLYAFLREAVMHIFAKRCHTPLPALSKKACPRRGVLVVITALLAGETHDAALFDALELYYLRNRGEGRVFGVLGDLPSHTMPQAVADEATLSYAKARIDALNHKYGGGFCLYVRSRQYSACEKQFFGKERKRGALLALAHLLRDGGSNDFLESTEPSKVGKIDYICTLDSDTVLPYGAIDSMLCVMEHPYNRPTVAGGRVVRGIGILQPAMAVELSSSAETRFASVTAGRGGYDPYGRYARDMEDAVLGHGGFCGKGMFCVDAFLSVLDGAFPAERILSHDFLEGQRLACRAIPHVSLFDTHPAHTLAYYARQERWVRGDVQALPYALGRVRRENGEKIKNPVPFSERLRIFDHVLCAMIPIAVLRAVLFIAFVFPSVKVGAALLLLSFSSYLLHPTLLLLRKRTWAAAPRVFSSGVLPQLWHSLRLLCYRLVFLSHEGTVNARAALLALWRMCVSKKHLLSWTTAAEAQRCAKRGVLFYTWQMRFSVLIGAILLLLAPQPLTRLIGALWLLAPVCAFLLDKRIKTEKTMLTSMQIRRLCAYAAPIWCYFEDHVTAAEHHLPPDNVQWFPYPEKRIAHRTSPTNIGLYLLSCLSALRFSFITPQNAAMRLLATLESLSALETCHGHFYNWYDTVRGVRIGAPYLSSVDSGNLACALIAAAKACERYASADIRFLEAAGKMTALAKSMDFSIFYDARRAALSIGFDTEKNKTVGGYYDLYCSEARSAVYFAVAMGQIPADAWDSLSRPILVHGRHIGVESWTGSAFEYFMPSLWLSVPFGSFSEQMLSYAARMQISDRETVCTREGCYPLFGRSEGAYCAFDEARIYQYQPYGVAALAAWADLPEQRLIMPYATFLMLPFAKGRHASLAPLLYQNLDFMEEVGMWGKYGFFESIDMTDARVGNGYAIVRSVMAHHLGMSLVALANTAFGDWFPACFSSCDEMRAASLLLKERIPTDAMPLSVKRTHRKSEEKDAQPKIPKRNGA